MITNKFQVFHTLNFDLSLSSNKYGNVTYAAIAVGRIRQ